MQNTVEQIYLNLLRSPRSQWKNIISQLNSKIQSELLILLREKKNKNTCDTSDTTSLDSVSLIQTPFSNDLTSVSIDGDQSCAKPDDLDNIRFPLKEKKCTHSVESPDISPRELNSNTSNINSNSNGFKNNITFDFLNSSFHNLQFNNILQELMSSVNYDMNSSELDIFLLRPLDKIKLYMFIAGDNLHVIPESEYIVHCYLTLWVDNLFQNMIACGSPPVKIDKNQTNKCSYNTNNTPTLTSSKFINHVKRHYSNEYKKYSRDYAFHKSVRSKLDDSNIENLIEFNSDPKLNNNILSPNSSQHSSDTDSNDITDSSNVLYKIRETILPFSRFANRLLYRDMRTQDLNELDYKEYTKARETSFKINKSVFIEWIRCIIENIFSRCLEDQEKSNTRPRAHITIKNFKNFFTKNIVNLLMFLVSDRITSVVELALKIREIYNNKIIQNPSYFDTLKLFDSNIDLYTLFFGKDIELTPLGTIIKRNIQYTVSIHPFYYIIAVNLFIIYLNEHSIPLLHHKPLLIFQQCILKIFKLKQSNSSLNLNGFNKKKNDRDCDEDQDHTCEEKMNILFTKVIHKATESNHPPILPERIDTFAFLCCRDVFWDYRYKPPSELWKIIEQKFKSLQSNPEEFQKFNHKYLKIKYYGEALHKIASLGLFLRSYSDNQLNS